MKLLIILLIIFIVLIYIYYYDIYMNYMTIFIVMRGIIAPKCKWWNMSELLLKDGSGVILYNKLKENRNSFNKINLFGNDVNLVTKNSYVKIILDNSPFIFGVGKMKKEFFNSFMKNNVGVSMGCPWKRRRKLNEFVLDTDKVHRYSNIYNTYIKNKIQQNQYNNFNDFMSISKILATKIIFNNDKVNDKVFQMFPESNSIEAFINPNFKVNPEIRNEYFSYLRKNIDNPKENSLVKLCTLIENDKEEIVHQIPHFIFPILGIFHTNIPRLLLLLCNHPQIFEKLIKEINTKLKENGDEYNSIIQMKYLRKCIMELLRLNNPVTSSFRTLLQDYEFNSQNKFKKGDQFLILNNPVLREKEYFKEPNKYIPERWNDEMEKSYYSISFNQGPQRCPSKELSIFLIQSFTVNLLKYKGILNGTGKIYSEKINTENIPQMINPCSIKFKFETK